MWLAYISLLGADPQPEAGEQTGHVVRTDGVVPSGGSGEGGSRGGGGDCSCGGIGGGDCSCGGIGGGTRRSRVLVGGTNSAYGKAEKKKHLCNQGKY